MDEMDVFYDNPQRFFQRYFDRQVGNKTLDWPLDRMSDKQVPGQTYTISKFNWASHIVTFDNDFVVPVLEQTLHGSNYRLVPTLPKQHRHKLGIT